MSIAWKNSVAVAAVAGVMAWTAPLMADDSPLGYLNVGGAISDVGALDNGVSGVLGLGFPMPGVDPQVSVEGELSKSGVAPRGRHRGVTETDTRESFDYFTLSGFATYRLPVANEVDLRGRGGMTYLDWEHGDVASDELGLSLGVGATYRITDGMNLLGDLSIMNTSPDVNHLTIGVQYLLD